MTRWYDSIDGMVANTEIGKFMDGLRELDSFEWGSPAFNACVSKLLSLASIADWLNTVEATELKGKLMEADLEQWHVNYLLLVNNPIADSWEASSEGQEFVKQEFEAELKLYQWMLGHEGPHFDLPVRVKALAEELASAFEKEPEGITIWKQADLLVRRRKDLLHRARVFKWAQEMHKVASTIYSSEVEKMFYLLTLRDIAPYGGGGSDPANWFVTAEFLVEWARKHLGWKVSERTLRFYTQHGLLPRPIRRGQGGKGLYSPTAALGLSIIREQKQLGATLEELKEAMPELLAQKLQREGVFDMPSWPSGLGNLVGVALDERQIGSGRDVPFIHRELMKQAGMVPLEQSWGARTKRREARARLEPRKALQAQSWRPGHLRLSPEQLDEATRKKPKRLEE